MSDLGTNVGTINLQMVLNNTNFNRKVYNTANSSKNVMNNAFKNIAATIATTFSIVQITRFAKSCISAANTFENAFVGLNSVVSNTGKSFKEATVFLQKYISDGLVPMNEAAASYKNLAIKGFSTEQIENLLTVAKDTAAFGRQGSLSMGKAIEGLTEGLKSDLSMMVDNAGVTKNLSVMTKEYAASIGKSASSLTELEKVQAYYNGIMWESRFQIGDAKKLMETYSGKVSKLSASFLQLKITLGELLKGALYPVIDFLSKLVSSLNIVLTKFKNFVMDFFNLKKSLFSNDGAINMDLNTGDISNDVQDAIKNIGSATAGAVETIKKSITGLDEVNILSKNETADVDSGKNNVSGNVPGFDNSSLEESNSLFYTLKDKFKPLQDSVDRFLDSLKSVKEFIKTLFLDFDTSFLEPFANFMLSEEGLPRLFDILTKLVNAIDWKKLNESFNDFFISLEPVAEFAWSSLMDFYEDFLVPIAAWTMNSALNTMLECLTAFNNNVDWNKLRTALDGLWRAIEPFAETIGNGLLWFFKEVLTPLATWTISNVLPVFLDGLAAIFGILDSVLQAFQPIAKWLFDNVLKQIAEFTGGLFVSILEGIVNVLKSFSDWCKEHKDLITDIVIVIGSFIAAWGIVNLVLTIQGIVTALGAFIASGGIAATVAGILGGAIAFITSPITLVILAIGALIAAGILLYKNWDEVKEFCKPIFDKIAEIIGNVVDKIKGFFVGIINFFKENWQTILEFLVNPFGAGFKLLYENCEGFRTFIDSIVSKIKDIFNSLKDSIVNAMKNAWQGIKDTFSNFKSFFKDIKDSVINIFSDLADKFKNVFKSAWEAVKNVFSTGGSIFSNIVSGISSVFKNIVNALIDGINSIVQKPFDKINDMLDSLRRLSIMGVRPFTWLPYISIPKIPRMYAQGMGSFQPGKPELVGVGDQRSGTEFILTEKQLTRVINQATSKPSGVGKGNVYIDNTVNVAGKRLYKDSTGYAQKNAIRAGAKIVTA